MGYINKNRHYSLFLTSAYGAYVKRKIGDVIFNGYINEKFPKYVITFLGCWAIRL